ncbi:TPA: hypothetical protein H1012_03470 [archaeon]|nr:hypothetical protein [Candidatus Naiadarchaeales archaeon SRR2090159.bin1288]
MNGLTKSGTILLLLITLLAVSVAFVGIAVAQQNCTINSSGGCTEQNITAPDQPGNYTYEICIDLNGDTDVNDAGECSNETIQVSAGTVPVASISAPVTKINFGDSVSLTGSGTPPQGSTLTQYEWKLNGASARTQQKSDPTDILVINDLDIGKYAISLLVSSADGQTSTAATRTITVSPPLSGNPVKIVPRVVTAGTSVRAYNMPGPLSSIECRASVDGVSSLCTSAGATVIDSCVSGRLTIPVVEFPTQTGAKKINFTIAESAAKVGTIAKRPIVQAGDLSFLVTPPQIQDATEANFGLLKDSDFIPGGLSFEAQSSIPIASTDTVDFTKGLFYALHRVKNCGITEVVSLTPLEYSGASKDQFVGTIGMPSDCLQGETCKYLIELVGAGSAGGQLIEFDFERGSDVMSVDSTVVDFGPVIAGDSADEQLVEITNNGNDVLTSLKVVESSSRLAATIDATALAPRETAMLSISLDTLATDIPSNYSEVIGLTAQYGADTEAVGITAKYEILEGGEIEPTGGFLVATPASVNFGQLVIGETATQVVEIANYGDADVSGMDVAAPQELETTLSATSLAPDETATLTMVLTIPPIAEDGEYSDTADVIAESGESVSIPISFKVGSESLACPEAELPTCEENEAVDSETDESGCNVFVCVSKAAKKNATKRLPPPGEEPESEKKGISKLALILTIIIIILAIGFVVFVLAVREGWIDLNDYPLLRDWIRKLGLGPLFEREVEVSRFTPKPPPSFGGAAAGAARPIPPRPPAPPSGQQPQQPVVRRQLTPDEKAKLDAYMKEHPEYAAWVKKRYGLK